MSSVPLTIGALGNLADNQAQLRELDDFIEVAEEQVPQVRPARKRSPLELILQAAQPVAQAFASSQAARPRDRRRAFIGALVQGGAALGLREVARPSLQREAQAQAEEARRESVLELALKERTAERLGQPQSVNALLARSGLPLEEIVELSRTPAGGRLVTRADGSVGVLDPRTREVFTPTEAVTQPLQPSFLPGPNLIPPLETQVPVELQPPPIIRGIPRGGLIDLRTGQQVAEPPEQPEKLPTASELKRTELLQASEAIDAIIARDDVADNAQAVADFLRTGKRRGLHNLTTAQVNVLLGVLEDRFKPRRGVDPTGAAARGSETQRRIEAIRTPVRP